MNDIYTRLKNGESLDNIMNGFADEANAAQARIEAEEQAAKDAEVARMKAYAEERARNEAKLTDLTSLLDDAFRFVAKWYPELELEEGDWTEDDLKVLANLVLIFLDVEVIKTSAKSKKAEAECTETIASPRKKLPVKIEMKPFPANKPVSTDDVFADFFKSLGL